MLHSSRSIGALALSLLASTLAIGSSAQAQPKWPESVDAYPADAAIEKPLYASLDITDDMWRSKSRLSGDNIHAMMEALADLGITRLYWLRNPGMIWNEWRIRSEGGALIENERLIVEAAHKAGLECWVIYKPFETGGFSKYPHEYPLEELNTSHHKIITLQSGNGLVAPIVIDRPDLLFKARPQAVDAHQTVTAIKLVSAYARPTRIAKGDLEIWTSAINGNYQKYSGLFDFTDAIEERDGKPVRVLTLSGLSIPPDQLFLLVRTRLPAGDASEAFANIPGRLIEVYGDGNVRLPGNHDDGYTAKGALTDAIKRVPLLFGDGGTTEVTPHYDRLPEGFGNSLDRQAFTFEAAATAAYGTRPIPERTLDAPEGYIAFAKGTRDTLPVLHPAHPESHDYWLAEINGLIDLGFDGVDIRVDNHSTWVADPEAYGFNEPVVAEYKRLYGVDIRTEPFDIDKWKRIQGDSYTEFLRKLRNLTRERGVPLDLHVNGVMGNVVPAFQLNNVPRTIEWQWERWIEEDLCDGIHLKLLPWPWGGFRGNGQEFVEKVIRTAQKHNKVITADARMNKWQLIVEKQGALALTPADIRELIDSIQWSWRSRSIDAVNLYEVFDFTYLDTKTGKAYISPAFRDILDGVRSGDTSALPDAPLQNWISEMQ